MALHEITNTNVPLRRRKVDVHVRVQEEYSTLGKLHLTEQERNARREAGHTNVDLWVDGHLYPHDPIAHYPPTFRDLPSIIQYVGDGENGMLGYCKRLATSDRAKVFSLSSHLHTLQVNYAHVHTSLLQAEAKVKELELEKAAASTYADKLRQTISHLKSTPNGSRERKRQLSHIETLAVGGGARKRRVQAVKNFLQDATGSANPGNCDDLLRSISTRKHVLKMIRDPRCKKIRKAVSIDIMEEVSQCISSVDIVNACDEVGISTKGYKALHQLLGDTLRKKGITHNIFPPPKRVSLAKAVSNEDVRSRIGVYHHIVDTLRIPSWGKKKSKDAAVSFEFNEFNNIFVDLIQLQKAMILFYGLPFGCSKVSFVLKLDECQIVKGRRLERMSVTLMNYAMSDAFKNTSASSTEGLDADEPIAGYCQRQGNTKKLFSVQSEKDIWWLGAVEVPKETYEVLTWVFERIPWVSNVIKSQVGGEQLEVDGLGSFQVDWHLGADLKTIKCMLGLTQGANTAHPCPWCMHGVRQKSKKKCKVVDSAEEECEDTGNCNGEWEGGVLSSPMLAAPNRDVRDKSWHPILPFPLKNVHFCTLHAFMRIFDRLLKCHIDYAFTMPGKARQDEAIARVEKILNEIGCHGGNVQIRVNHKTSGVSHMVAQKVSMSGGKARRFLQKPTKKLLPVPENASAHDVDESLKVPTKRWDLWKDLCACTTSDCLDANIVVMREQVWASFNKVVQLMSKSTTTEGTRKEFQAELQIFIKAVVLTWGELNIVHYMHILYAHGAWFMNSYGSLDMWSTQGMEKSHYVARGVYFKNTRHGGGKTRSNYLKEMFDWFFRYTFGRNISSERARMSKLARLARREKKGKKTAAWMGGTGPACHAAWRVTRRRVGKVWVPRRMDEA